MADVNADINIDINTSQALAQLKALQRQISQFHSSIARSSEAAALAQRDLQKNFLNSVNAIGAFSAELRSIRTTAESFTDSLEKNKFGMREYFRYSAGATKTFGRFFRSEFETINKVAEENVKRLQTQYIKMGRDANGVMRAIAIMPKELDLSNYTTQTQIAAQRQALFNQLVKQGTTNLLNFGKNTQWAGRQLMVGFTLPLMALGTTASRTFMEMEAAALKFRKVYGDLFTPTEERAQALENITELGRVFTQYGIAVSDTVSLAADAAAAGFQGIDLQRQVTEATRLQVLGQIDQQKALETTISLQNAFQLSSENLSDSINFLNAVENQTVVSLDDITTAIPKVAPVIMQLGGSVKDLAFFMTAMKQGGVNASEGANALKSGLASLINPTEKAAKMLAAMGVNITQIVEANQGDLRGTVIEFAKALDTLDPLTRARAIEQLFGKFQFARLSTLFENVTKQGTQAARVLELAGYSASELAATAESELGMTAESGMNKFRKAVETLKLELVPVGQTFLEAVTPIVDFIGGILEKFNGLSSGTKKAITILTVAIGAIGPVVLMTFGLLANALANILKGANILRNGYLRLTGQSSLLAAQTDYLTIEQQNAAAVASSLDQTHAKLTQTFNVEAAAVDKLAAAYRSAVSAGARFATNNPGMMLPRKPQKFAKGGEVFTVPGSGNQDTVPAMLTPGEFVIPKRQAKKYGPLIQGIIADNIPGFNEGGTVNPSLMGGQQKIVAPYTMFAPGNLPGGFGMSEEFFRNVAEFTKSLANTAVASGSIEGNIKLTDQIIAEMLQEVNPYAEQITDQLQIAAQEMKDSGKSATHISELFTKKEKEIKTILSKMSATGPRGKAMAEGLRIFAYPTDEDILGGGNVRTAGVTVDPATGKVLRSTQYSNRTGKAGKFQTRIQKVTNLNPLKSRGLFTRAHVVPETRALPGKMQPLSGRVLQLPMEKQLQARAEIERRSATLTQQLGRSDAFAYNKGRMSANIPDIYVESRQRKSPHRLAPEDGRDDAIAYANARDTELSRKTTIASQSRAKLYGAGPVDPIQKSLRRQIEKQQRGMRISQVAQGVSPNPQLVAAAGANMAVMNQRLDSLNGKFMGAMFGLTSLAGALSFAGGGAGKFGEILFQITGPMFALSSILQLFTGEKILGLIKNFKFAFGAATIALVAGIGIFKLVNAARQREHNAINSVADAMTITAEKTKALGDFFGVVPNKLPFQTAGNLLAVGARERTQLEGLKADEGFQTQFKDTIANLRAATAEEAKLIFQNIGMTLSAQGFAAEQINTIVKALKEESGKIAVEFDFTKFKFEDFEANISDAISSFETAFATGYSEVTQSAVSRATGEIVTWTDQIISKDLKKNIATLGTTLGTAINAISGQMRNGIITSAQYSERMAKINEKFNMLDETSKKLLLARIFQGFDEKTQKALTSLAPLGSKIQMLAVQALAAGVAMTGFMRTLDLLAKSQQAIKAGTDPREIAAFNRAVGQTQKDLTDALNQTTKSLEAANKAEQDAINNKDGKKGLLQEETENLRMQIKAYENLRKANIDAATASQIAGNAEMAKLLQTNAGIKQNIGAIREYARLTKQLAQLQEAGMDIGDATIADLNRKKSFIELQEQLITMQYSHELERQNSALRDQEYALDQISQKIAEIERKNILPIQETIEKNNFALEKIGLVEDEINAKYDKQQEVLSKVLEINEDIAKVQKARISIADALTRGDISAAAQSVQDLRAQQASISVSNQQKNLDAARQQELSALRRKEIEKENKKLQFDILKIQFEQIRPLEQQKSAIQLNIDGIQNFIAKIEYATQVSIENMNKKLKETFGGTKTEIENALRALDLSKAAGIDIDDPNLLQNILKAAGGDAKSLSGLLDTLPTKFAAVLAAIAKLRAGMDLEELPKIPDVPIGNQNPDVPIGNQNRDISTNTITENANKAAQEFLNAQEAVRDAYMSQLNAGLQQTTIGTGIPTARGEISYDNPWLGVSSTPAQAGNIGSAVGNQSGFMSLVDAMGVSWLRKGGMAKPKFMAAGGIARGSDKIPAMLSPGEFVVSKYGVQNYGVDNLRAINSGEKYSDSVYNYSVSINVKSDSDANQIAKAVIDQIKYIDGQRVRRQKA